MRFLRKEETHYVIIIHTVTEVISILVGKNVADQKCVHSDPDPTFQFDPDTESDRELDPDPKCRQVLSQRKKIH